MTEQDKSAKEKTEPVVITPPIKRIVFPSFAFPGSGEQIVVDGKTVTAITWNYPLQWIDVFNGDNLVSRINPQAVAYVAY